MSTGEDSSTKGTSLTKTGDVEASNAKPLSLYQKWLTVPSNKPSSNDAASGSSGALSEGSGDSSSDHKAAAPVPDRKFSWKSKGSVLLIFAGIFLIIAIILCVTLPLTLIHKHKTSATDNSTPSLQPSATGPQGSQVSLPASPSSPSDPLAFRYSNPPMRLGVLANFPDPSIYYDASSKIWYAYGTNDAAGILRGGLYANTANNNNNNNDPAYNIQLASSTDFETWTLEKSSGADPLPTVGAWAFQMRGSPTQLLTATRPSHTATATHSVNPAASTVSVSLANVWAPDVIRHPKNGQWLMFYSAASASKPRFHCIGAASASSPSGPFQPVATALACPLEKGGAIDPAAFVEPSDGQIYVVYKIDGNSLGNGGACGNTQAPIIPTPIMLQRMMADGITPDSTWEAIPIATLTNDDGPLIEAPVLVKAGSMYHLFFSSGCTRTPSYNVRVASALKITGPYTRAAQPLIQTGSFNLTAPGSVSVRYGPNSQEAETSSDQTSGWKIALHARVGTNKGGVRAMFTAGLVFDGANVSITNGSTSVV